MADDLSSEPAGSSGQVVIGLSLTLGVILIAALLPEWFSVYFRIDGEAVTPTADQKLTYVLTASIGLGLLLVAAITAVVTRRAGATVAAVILLLVGLVVAGVFRVPQDFGTPPPVSHTANPDYTPCYSGSDNPCPGG